MFYYWLTLFLVISYLIISILPFTLFAWQFSRKIIPEIERKLGKKLVYPDLYYCTPYFKTATAFNVALFIVIRYLVNRCGGKAENWCKGQMALYKAGYALSQCTRKEIVWSVLYVMDIVIWFAVPLTAVIVKHT